MVKCPDCDGHLVILEFQGIEVDHCPACGGTWLDADDLGEIEFQAGATAGSLARLLTGRADSKATAGHEHEHGHKHGHDHDHEHGHRHCPRCGRHMVVDTVGEADPVQIDRCPRGCGFWYDRGELKRLIACHKDGDESVVAEFFMQMLRDTLS